MGAEGIAGRLVACTKGAARRGELNAPSSARSVDFAMLRSAILAGALLVAAAAPAHAMGHSGGHSGGHHGGGSVHGHHEGFHHRGFRSFVGVGVFDPWFPYDYPYPYPYGYPYAYPPPVVVEPQPPVVVQEPIQREVVYPTGKYELHGDGINYPWQWVWIPAPPPPPATPAP